MLQAKFLKACGTIASTPAEIRKASEKLKVSPSCSNDSGPPKFRSWLLDTSAENVPTNVQPFNPPTPKKQCEEWEKRTDCSDHTPSRLLIFNLIFFERQSLTCLMLVMYNIECEETTTQSI